jgi:alpha-galactosidase
MILTNAHAIAVDQDPLGQMGVRLDATATPTQRWARTLANGDVAVALFNLGDGTGAAADITIEFSDVNMVGSVNVFDIWQQQSAGPFTGNYTAKAVPFHGTAFVRLSQA